MKTAFALTPELEEILAHMETDHLSIAPYLDGYIIAPKSKKQRKLKLLKDPSAVQVVDFHGKKYSFVEKLDWERVKDLIPPPELIPEPKL